MKNKIVRARQEEKKKINREKTREKIEGKR